MGIGVGNDKGTRYASVGVNPRRRVGRVVRWRRRGRAACARDARKRGNGRGLGSVCVLLSVTLITYGCVHPEFALAEDNVVPIDQWTDIVDGSFDAWNNDGLLGLLRYWGHTKIDYSPNDWNDLGGGFWGSNGGDFGGGGSSSSSGGGSSSSSEQQGLTAYATLLLNGSADTVSSGGHNSYRLVSDTGYSYNGSSSNIYSHTWATVTTIPRIESVQLYVNARYAQTWQQWRSAGYDLILVNEQRAGNANASIRYALVESGGWHYDSDTSRYVLHSGAKYRWNSVSVNTYYDGSNVRVALNVDPLSFTPTVQNSNANIDARTTNVAGCYVSVLYGDGSTGSGGADTGGGSGGGGSSGDTYNNNTNNYTTNTTYNNLDLDLSPITHRQDITLKSINQIGKDITSLMRGIDADLLRIFQAMMLDVGVNRANGVTLSNILAELQGGSGGGSGGTDLTTLEGLVRSIRSDVQDMKSDVDAIILALTNLQDSNGLATIRGYLKSIDDTLSVWPAYPVVAGVDLTNVESLVSAIRSDVQDMKSDVDSIILALTNLQDSNGLATIRGYLKSIDDTLRAWPAYPAGGGVGSDLSAIESKLDEVIRLLRSLDGGNDTNVSNDNEVNLGEQIAEKMDMVRQRFPFSIPWDVMYILGLLKAAPVAPQFDLPTFGSDDIHVNLAQWEPVAVVTRSGTLLLFGLGLALRSKSLITTWGGSGD